MSKPNVCRNRSKKWLLLAISALPLMSPCMLRGSSAETGDTSILDIPVGGRPAAMGGAYSALATDAYAVNLNPGGLGFLRSTQFSGQHVSYLESSQYNYLSMGVPLPRSAACGPSGACPGTSLGGSIQYFSAGNFTGTDMDGNPTGDFSSHVAVYNVSFGRAFTNQLSFGLTGKWINAQIANVSANAYAGDLGTMYQVNKNVTMAAVLTNVGTKLTFINQGNPLPTALHIGMAYQVENHWSLSAEGVAYKSGAASAHLGFEYRPIPMASLRVSYRTDGPQNTSAMTGVAAGIGIQFNGMDFSYAWKPMAELGVTQYFSFGYSFDEHPKTQGDR
jgi:hypothetical protein